MCGRGGSRALRTRKQAPWDCNPSSSTLLFFGCHLCCIFCTGACFRCSMENPSRRNAQMVVRLAMAVVVHLQDFFQMLSYDISSVASSKMNSLMELDRSPSISESSKQLESLVYPQSCLSAHCHKSCTNTNVCLLYCETILEAMTVNSGTKNFIRMPWSRSIHCFELSFSPLPVVLKCASTLG